MLGLYIVILKKLITFVKKLIITFTPYNNVNNMLLGRNSGKKIPFIPHAGFRNLRHREACK